MVKDALEDIVAPGLSVLFVGINPSLRSAELGHHYAGHGNRFWKLLYESGLVDRPMTFADDRSLLSFNLGSTNIVARPTASCNELGPEDYALGRRRLARKIARLRPRVVAFIGVVVFREFFGVRGPVACGLQPAAPALARASRRRQPSSAPLKPSMELAGAAVYVLPNPSGRNAHYSHARMVELYRGLAEMIRA